MSKSIKKRDQKGRIVPGNPGGPGRPKGQEDQKTIEIKQVIREMVSRLGQPEEMDLIMRECKADTKLNFLAKVAPKNMEISGLNGEPMKWTINILDNGRQNKE